MLLLFIVVFLGLITVRFRCWFFSRFFLRCLFLFLDRFFLIRWRFSIGSLLIAISGIIITAKAHGVVIAKIVTLRVVIVIVRTTAASVTAKGSRITVFIF